MGFVFFFCVLMFELRGWGGRFLVPVPVGEAASSSSGGATAVLLRRLEFLGEWAARGGRLEQGVAWLMAVAGTVVTLHGRVRFSSFCYAYARR